MLCFSVSSATLKLLGGSVLGLAVWLTGAVAIAAVNSVSAEARSPEMRTAQLFERFSPTGCTATGCRLTIDQVTLRNGAVVTARYRGEDRQVIQRGEIRQLTLNLSQPVVNSAGQVVLLAESLIEGEVVPVEGGSRFIASRIIANGTTYNLSAQSSTLHDVKDPRQVSTAAIAQDAAIGAAGAVAVGQVLGQRRITVPQVVGGAAAGVAVGNVTAPRAVVIEPDQEILLELTNDFRL